MTPALVFALGILAGLSTALCVACCVIGARTPCPQPVPQPAPERPHAELLPSCSCLGCVTAADIYAVRQLPEVGAR